PGTLITSVTDSAAQNGWYHVALPQTMNVSAGQDFFVAVKIINKAYGISFDYSTPTGRSYSSSDGVNYDNDISAYGDINIRARIQTGTPTALEELLLTPEQFRLAQNYPNPFNPATVIEYNLPQKSMVKLEIFNTLGKRVAVLQNGVQPAGVHSINFDASGLASGVYYYRIETDFGRQGKQMLLLK
ncbi:MAG TPA: T9SS type A sorting domain-containing protein, partial [Caldithrix abyssi]|nr:T9SS type A sorting domain-containing protein [Caldithrix abyssi]